MFLVRSIFHLVAVFICFLAYPVNADVCLQGFTVGTPMQCKNCTGDLKVVFASNQTVPYDSSDRIQSLNCTVNKPANISILFEHKLKPYNKKPVELTKDGKVKGITVTKLNGGCTYTIQFEEYSKSLCQYGHFTCKAVTDVNETDSRTIEVSVAEEKNLAPLTFTVEDAALQKTNELITGTSANLSCSYASREWVAVMPFLHPFATFLRLDKGGNETEIKDSHEVPPKYENQGEHDVSRRSGETAIGTRRLFLRHIDAGAATTYLCRVRTYGCQLEKKLVLKTRLCKKGHYCNQNSSKELPCREGTYSNIVGSFNASNCRICPINSYCPSGSSSPKQCPRHDFRPARLMKVKLYLGKGKQSDCRSCPVDPCDKDATKCSFICSKRQHYGVLGQPISVRCSLSNGTLLRNLTWFRGGKKIINGSSYGVYREESAFILKIHKVSQEDIGEYNCSGFDMIMGNHVFSTTNLVASKPGKSFRTILTLSLTLSIVVVILVVTGLIVRKCLRSRKEPNWTPIGNPYKHDVFICYCSNDKIWVRGTLLPKLKSFNLQVCIDFEDFSPGRYIIENVAESINSSRKTVAVLSPDFLKSAWCHKELMMALSQANNEHNVLPVMYRECQVPPFLSEVTYLDWCNEDVKQTFWKQLLKTINNGKQMEINDEAGCLEESIDNRSTESTIGL